MAMQTALRNCLFVYYTFVSLIARIPLLGIPFPFVFLQFFSLLLQGWQRKLDPDYNVMKTLQTLLFKEDWAKSLQYTIQGLMAP